MKDKKTKSGLIVLVVIAAISAAIGVFRVTAAGGGVGRYERSGGRTSVDFTSRVKPYIAVISIKGVIQEAGSEYNQRWILNTIKSLEEDDKNKGILLFIDSPGGTVYHADETYLALLDYKTSGKNVYAYLGSMAASGGYYIACAADKIYSNRNTLTGSIGVISASTIDATGLLEKLGIKSTTIHAGKNKNMLSYNEPLTDEQREIMQSLADEAYDQFTQIVSSSRGMELERTRELADGRVYSAQQAKANGLIDEICTLEQAEEAVKAEYSFDSLVFRNLRYERSDTLRSMLLEGFSAIKEPLSLFSRKPVLSYIYEN